MLPTGNALVFIKKTTYYPLSINSDFCAYPSGDVTSKSEVCLAFSVTSPVCAFALSCRFPVGNSERWGHTGTRFIHFAVAVNTTHAPALCLKSSTRLPAFQDTESEWETPPTITQLYHICIYVEKKELYIHLWGAKVCSGALGDS